MDQTPTDSTDVLPDAAAWWRTARHREFGSLTLTEQVSYFAAHEPTHLRQVRAAAVRSSR
jgi:hypothetical protein